MKPNGNNAQTIDGLDPAAIAKVSGPAWEPMRTTFFQVCEALLSATEEVCSELTTVYVKFMRDCGSREVYAVVWIKSSKQLVIGLALPEDVDAPEFTSAPRGTSYRGLTKYLCLRPSDDAPQALSEWAKQAEYAVGMGE